MDCNKPVGLLSLFYKSVWEEEEIKKLKKIFKKKSFSNFTLHSMYVRTSYIREKFIELFFASSFTLF